MLLLEKKLKKYIENEILKYSFLDFKKFLNFIKKKSELKNKKEIIEMGLKIIIEEGLIAKQKSLKLINIKNFDGFLLDYGKHKNLLQEGICRFDGTLQIKTYGKLDIYYLEAENVNIIGTVINQLNIQECSIKKITLDEKTFIYDKTIQDIISKIETKLTKKISIVKNNADEIIIQSITSDNENSQDIRVSILENNFKKLEINYARGIHRLLIKNNYSSENIKIRNLYTTSQESSGFFLTNLQTETLTLDNIVNLSNNFVLQNLTIGNLIIKNSDLGRMKFNSVKVGKLTLENTTLNDCILNGVTFDTYELGDEIDGKKIPLEKLKDNYRQLKHVMDKNNNYLEANKFYALELSTYSRILKSKNLFKKGWLTRLHREEYDGQFAKEVSDYIVLRTSRIISDFGNNWVSPIFFILLIALTATCIDYIYQKGLIDVAKSTNELLIIKKDYIQKIKGFSELMWLTSFILIVVEIIRRLGQKSVIIIIFSLLFLGTCLELLGNYKALSIFLDFLNPLYGLSFTKEDVETMSFLEKLGLTTYKILYGILLYYLYVALKRTTKR